METNFVTFLSRYTVFVLRFERRFDRNVHRRRKERLLESIMLSSNELRKQNQRDELFSQTIRKEHGLVKSWYVNHIYKEIVHNAQKNRYCFNIFNYHMLYNGNERLQGCHVKPSTLFTGFWDSVSCEHTWDGLAQAKVRPMLVELQEEFAPLGYHITDISDPSRSFKQVLQVKAT